MKRYRYLWVSILIILLDQATKLRVRHFMELGESIPIIGDFFRLTYVTNTGAAFSMSFGDGLFNKVFFLVVPLVAVVILLFLMYKDKQGGLMQVGYALILGGAIGNYIDRLAYGSVVDFLDFDFFDIIIERWPVFNVADSAIVVAFILLLVEVMILEPLKSKRVVKELTLS